MADVDAWVSDELAVTHTQQTGAVVIEVEGDVDIVSSDHLRPVLLDAATAGPHLILDLTAVTFLDSTALSLLVATHKRAAKSQHPFSIVVGAQHQRLLAITGLEGYLRVHQTLQDALGNPQDG